MAVFKERRVIMRIDQIVKVERLRKAGRVNNSRYNKKVEGYTQACEEYDSKEIELNKENFNKILADKIWNKILEADAELFHKVIKIVDADVTDTIADNLEKLLRVKE